MFVANWNEGCVISLNFEKLERYTIDEVVAFLCVWADCKQLNLNHFLSAFCLREKYWSSLDWLLDSVYFLLEDEADAIQP